MVDNFALFVSQLMMIIVLWRCFVLPTEDGRADEAVHRVHRPKRRGAGRIKDARKD